MARTRGTPRRDLSSVSVPRQDVVEEQRRLLAIVEQERADHAMAMRLQNEENSAPTPQRNQNQTQNSHPTTEIPYFSRPRPTISIMASGRRRQAPPLPTMGPRARLNPIPPVTNRRPARRPSQASQSGRGGGPIRRTTRTAPPRRDHAGRIVPTATLQFNGDRLIARTGNESVDITADTYFPDDDEDEDYNGADSSDDDGDISVDSDSDEAMDDEEEEVVAPTPPRSAVRGGSRRGAPAAGRGRSQRGRRGGPAVSGDYIRMLLSDTLQRSSGRSPNYVPPAADDDDESSDDGMDVTQRNDEDDGDSSGDSMIVRRRLYDVDIDSEGTIQIGDSDDDEEDGPIRADRNHINQPMFEEDRAMYHHELDLYLNDNEYVVPPPKEQKVRGKPIEPDSTWGDCTMCSSPPVKPQGCTKCLQILGCADCVSRWHVTRSGSIEGPSCPLCRAQWGHRPSVMLMKSIEKRREKENKSSSTSSEPSTSSASSSSSSK